MGFALQIAATDKAVVVAKNAPVIINAVIFYVPLGLKIDYAYAGVSSFTRRTPVVNESAITIVANTAIFVPSVDLFYHGFIISRCFLRKKQANL